MNVLYFTLKYNSHWITQTKIEKKNVQIGRTNIAKNNATIRLKTTKLKKQHKAKLAVELILTHGNK